MPRLWACSRLVTLTLESVYVFAVRVLLGLFVYTTTLGCMSSHTTPMSTNQALLLPRDHCDQTLRVHLESSRYSRGNHTAVVDG